MNPYPGKAIKMLNWLNRWSCSRKSTRPSVQFPLSCMSKSTYKTQVSSNLQPQIPKPSQQPSPPLNNQTNVFILSKSLFHASFNVISHILRLHSLPMDRPSQRSITHEHQEEHQWRASSAEVQSPSLPASSSFTMPVSRTKIKMRRWTSILR